MKRLLFALVFIAFISCVDKKATTTEPSLKQEEQKPIVKKKYDYELIGTKHNNAVDNFYIVLKTESIEEDSIMKAMFAIKSELCTKPCNLSAYDDKKYLDFENEYENKKRELGEQLGSGEITQAKYKTESFKLGKKYYVRIADHLIGYIEFSDESLFMYYPYKDFYYKELGGDNPKD